MCQYQFSAAIFTVLSSIDFLYFKCLLFLPSIYQRWRYCGTATTKSCQACACFVSDIFHSVVVVLRFIFLRNILFRDIFPSLTSIFFFYYYYFWMKNTSVAFLDETFHLLVVQDNIGKPNVFGGYVEFGHPTIFIWVPFQFVVLPLLNLYEFNFWNFSFKKKIFLFKLFFRD